MGPSLRTFRHPYAVYCVEEQALLHILHAHAIKSVAYFRAVEMGFKDLVLRVFLN